MHIRKLVIAIDGPAASGKSTTARLVAERLGYIYIDTGAMYRAVTLAVLKDGIDPQDQHAVEQCAGSLRIEFSRDKDMLHTLLNGEDVSTAIRTPEVTANVSLVSSYPRVREYMVTQQRAMGESGGVVLDGRDIGTVVFPNADLKIFMIADIHARAQRRLNELLHVNPEITMDQLVDELTERDRFDSTRTHSPLTKAADALEVDTSTMSIGQQVDYVVEHASQLITDH